MFLLKINEDGFTKANKQEIKEHLKQIFINAYGEDINLNDNYPDGILINFLTEMFDDTFKNMQKLFNLFNPYSSSGEQLDIISSLLGIQRKNSKEAMCIVNINLKNTSNKKIDVFLENNIIKDINKNIWRVEPIHFTVPESDPSFKINIILKNISEGKVQKPTKFIFPEVSNDELEYNDIKLVHFIQGEDFEDDITLRNRLQRNHTNNSINILSELQKNLLNIEGVKDVKIYANDTDKELTTNLYKDSLPLKILPTHILVLISYEDNVYDDLLKNKQEIRKIIAKTIYKYKGVTTITSVGKNNTAVDTEDNNRYRKVLLKNFLEDSNLVVNGEVNFIEVEKIKLDAVNDASTIKLYKGIEYQNLEDTKELLYDLIIKYFKEVRIGEIINKTKFIMYLNKYNQNKYFINDIILPSVYLINKDQDFYTAYNNNNLEKLFKINIQED